MQRISYEKERLKETNLPKDESFPTRLIQSGAGICLNEKAPAIIAIYKPHILSSFRDLE